MYLSEVERKEKTMCKFCEPTKQAVKVFEEWVKTNPYIDGEQVEEEGIDFMLYPDGIFIMGAAFDGGYIGDAMQLHFKFCPMCGKKF